MSESELKAENERLRSEIESYRQRELEDLRSQLAAARQERDYYRSEANRNAEVGRQIHATMQEEVERLRSQIDTKDQLLRQANRVGANAHTRRN